MNEQYIERYWRDAKPEDAIREPPMVARFRNHGQVAWNFDKLICWDRSDHTWVGESRWTYDLCQVYDASTSAPDQSTTQHASDISSKLNTR